MKAVLPALARPLIEAQLPAGLDVHWFASLDDAIEMVADADIGWVDNNGPANWARAVAAGRKLQWLSTIYAGLDPLDKDQLRAQGTRVTNGSGVNAHTVAEYAVMGALVAAKRYDQVVRIADTHVWPFDAPGKLELFETNALVIGYGTIGRLIGERLAAFGVTVTGVTRTGAPGTIGPDAWRDRLAEFDWIFLAAPSTDQSRAMIGEAELKPMKPSAWIINVGRGELIDQDALIEAVTKRRIAGAFLDTVSPEPLPPEHPLWTTPNILLSMHLSGRSQTRMFVRAAALFVENIHAFLEGRPLRNEVDLAAGY
ncbi:D-2-hydroxyacid dehydrogenase [Sphingomonas psychrotolerans]|uniref:D-2-hydroxyacid dehydrogenase n=1 Tax=Sphingomonas psychrotolerans TaxID=1327635 RepID=A0ABU3N3F4_9SPHN|nr:NAD(P)-dependent oxidoreductase [Sphingomonas psychrotolerans]MDT8758026.1 D-2-hydroxyacid dehydrogenase [Sphingomonas psychrotolerans]